MKILLLKKYLKEYFTKLFIYQQLIYKENNLTIFAEKVNGQYVTI